MDSIDDLYIALLRNKLETSGSFLKNMPNENILLVAKVISQLNISLKDLEKLQFDIFNNPKKASIYSRLNISFLDKIIKLLEIGMNEEGRGYFNDLKSEWKKSGLTQNHINRKELRFILSHYWGGCISWMRLPRFLSPTKTR